MENLLDNPDSQSHKTTRMTAQFQLEIFYLGLSRRKQGNNAAVHAR